MRKDRPHDPEPCHRTLDVWDQAKEKKCHLQQQQWTPGLGTNWPKSWSSVVASVRNLKYGTLGAVWISFRNDSRRRRAE